MRNLFRLTRFLLKNGQGRSQSENGEKKRMALYILLAVCFLPVAGLLFAAGQEMYRLLHPVGMEAALIEVICIVGALTFFLFGLASVLSVFYLSADVTMLLPLPLRPAEIVGAKWLICLLQEYLLVLFVFLPLLAGYGFAGQMGAGYWILAALGCAALPAVPLIYGAVLTMLIMRVFKNIRNKDFLSYLGLILALVLAVGAQFLARGMENVQAESVVGFLEGQEGLFHILYRIFPSFTFLSRGIGYASLPDMLLFYVTTLAFLVVFLLIAQKIYLPAALGMSEAAGSKKKLTDAQVQKELKRKDPIKAYRRIEWKKLCRTPVYFMNCVLMALIWPVLCLAIILFSVFQSAGDSEFQELMRLLSDGGLQAGSLLRGDFPVAVAVLVVGCAVAFFSLFCQISSTAISRQGKNFIFMKFIPLSYEEQIRGLVSCGIRVGTLGILPLVLILNAGAVFFGLHPVTLVYSTAIVVLFVHMVNYQQLYMDICHPKLEWDTETAAVKQNYRAMLSMVINLLIGGALIGLGFLLYRNLSVNIHLLTVLLILVLTALTVWMRHLLFSSGTRVLEKLE